MHQGGGANAATIPRPRVPGVRGAEAPRAHPPARGIRLGDRRRRRPCPAPGSVCKVSRGAEGSAHPPANRRGGRGASRGTERRNGQGRGDTPSRARVAPLVEESPGPASGSAPPASPVHQKHPSSGLRPALMRARS
nr:fibroblast growth factor 2-like [Symphalangus syndactylus]